jgi:tetratricopeptide (TPR) repeat protein
MMELLMKYCPSCGKAEVERMKFCPRCGQKLMDFDLGGKQKYVQRPEAPLKERNWFERHLNWTMVLAWAGSYLIVFIVAFLVALGDPNISEDAIAGMGLIIGLIVSIAVGQWVLKKKNRSLAWLLICGTWFFLLIENHSFMRDEHGRTMTDYDKLIELDPDNAAAYCERGDFYYEMDEYDKAVTDYNKAIELAPNDANAYYNRGCAYGETGEYDKAIADYDKAIELDPSDANTYYDRGLAYHEKGEVPKTVSDLEKCIALSSDPELTEDARQALYEMKKSP